MDFLLELAKKKENKETTKQVEDLVNEHKKMIADNDSRFQKMLDIQEEKRQFEQERIIELLDSPTIAPREV